LAHELQIALTHTDNVRARQVTCGL
jgi:hypothetical protein